MPPHRSCRSRHRPGGWLAVPALFPTTQYYYAMFALPVGPFVAAAMAFPWPGVPAVVTIGYAIVRVAREVRQRRFGQAGPRGGRQWEGQ